MPRSTFNRRNPIGDLVSSIAGVVLTNVARTVEDLFPEGAGLSTLDLTAGISPLYDEPVASIAATASEAERLAWIEERLRALGRGASYDLFTPNSPEAASFDVTDPDSDARWLFDLRDRATCVGLAIASRAHDAVLCLIKRPDRLEARIGARFRQRLADLGARRHLAREEGQRTRRGWVLDLLSTIPGLTWADAQGDLPSPDVLSATIPRWQPDRRAAFLMADGYLKPEQRPALNVWLSAVLEGFNLGDRFFLWASSTTPTWIEIRVPRGERHAWIHAVSLARIGPERREALERFALLSADGRRALFFAREEYHVMAFTFTAAVLLDRAASRRRLLDLIAAGDRLRFAGIDAISAPAIDPRSVIRRAHRIARIGHRISAATARSRIRAAVAALHASFPMSEALEYDLTRVGAVMRYAVSIGSIGPPTWIDAHTFDDGDWLADLWEIGCLKQIFVRSPDDSRVLAMRRSDDLTEIYLAPGPARARR